ncbi:hypothetical protein ABBQ32_010748 [Trebouxia sp. C0010 RCD-2024]
MQGTAANAGPRSGSASLGDKAGPAGSQQQHCQPAVFYTKARASSEGESVSVVFRQAAYVQHAEKPGTFTGERWLDQTMQLPSVKSKGFIFTQTGVVYAVPVDRLPSCEGASFEDLAISKVIAMTADDNVINVMLAPESEAVQAYPSVIMVTAAGFMTHTPWDRMAIKTSWNNSKVVGMGIMPDLSSQPDTDGSRLQPAYLLLATEKGMAKRVPVREFQEQAMGQQGVKAITLAVGDAVVAVLAGMYPERQAADEQCLVALSSKGHITKRVLQEVPMLARAAVGQHLIKMQVTVHFSVPYRFLPNVALPGFAEHEVSYALFHAQVC